MKNVTLDLNNDNLDFTVTFHFDKNDYFDHETLFKSFVYDKTTFEPTSATSSKITWKEGMNPTVTIKNKKKKSKFILLLFKIYYLLIFRGKIR